MNSLSGFDNFGNSSWPSFVPFQERVYQLAYAGSLDAHSLQAIFALEHSSVFNETWYAASPDRRIRA